MPGDTTPRAAWIWLAVLASALGLLVLSFAPHAKLRFSLAALNDAAFLAFIWAIPISLVGLAVTLRLPYAKIALFFLGLALGCPAFFISCFVGLGLLDTLSQGYDGSFQQLAELEGHSRTFRAYRSNGGATTSFSVVLQREIDIFPGLRLVSPACSINRAREAQLSRLSEIRGGLQVDGERGCEFDL